MKLQLSFFYLKFDYQTLSLEQNYTLFQSKSILFCRYFFPQGVSRAATVTAHAEAGSLDPTFGPDGKVTTYFGGSNETGMSVTIQTDGKIIVAGMSGPLSNYDFAVARYNGSSTVDIAENNTEGNTINISPNPFTNELSVKGTKEKGEIIIFDMRGKEVMRQKTFDAETKIKAESLLPGYYLLNYKNGNKTANIKLLKL